MYIYFIFSGKSTFLRQYTDREYREKFIPTVGMDLLEKLVVSVFQTSNKSGNSLISSISHGLAQLALHLI